MPIKASAGVKKKLLEKHQVEFSDVVECFSTREGTFLTDDRADHKTDPVSQWFISDTFMGRLLKVVFVYKDGDFFIKTAYEPNAEARRIYAKYGKKES